MPQLIYQRCIINSLACLTAHWFELVAASNMNQIKDLSTGTNRFMFSRLIHFYACAHWQAASNDPYIDIRDFIQFFFASLLQDIGHVFPSLDSDKCTNISQMLHRSRVFRVSGAVVGIPTVF